MENHFLENISINNFKCFEKLEFGNFKRVNLIGGKNNIGKTSFMEALNLAVSSYGIEHFISSIKKMLENRQNIKNNRLENFEIDFFYNDNDSIEISSNINNITIKYFNNIHDYSSYNRFTDYEIGNNRSYFSVKINDDAEDNINTNYMTRNYIARKKHNFSDIKKYFDDFINSSTISNMQIAIFYGNLIDMFKEHKLDEALQIFDDNIIAFKQIIDNKNNVILKLKLKDRKNLVLLSSFGEGINRYIAIICAIWANQNGYIFIDEIENGIHYTNYTKLWKLIFDISKEANCQVFAATHSKECIEAFNKYNENNEGIYLELYKNNKTNIINIKERDNEQLDYSLNNNGEFRGE